MFLANDLSNLVLQSAVVKILAPPGRQTTDGSFDGAQQGLLRIRRPACQCPVNRYRIQWGAGQIHAEEDGGGPFHDAACIGAEPLDGVVDRRGQFGDQDRRYERRLRIGEPPSSAARVASVAARTPSSRRSARKIRPGAACIPDSQARAERIRAPRSPRTDLSSRRGATRALRGQRERRSRPWRPWRRARARLRRRVRGGEGSRRPRFRHERRNAATAVARFSHGRARKTTFQRGPTVGRPLASMALGRGHAAATAARADSGTTPLDKIAQLALDVRTISATSPQRRDRPCCDRPARACLPPGQRQRFALGGLRACPAAKIQTMASAPTGVPRRLS